MKDLKEAVLLNAADDTPARAWWRDSSGLHEQMLTLGTLKNQIVQFVPGAKICYVTDAAPKRDNAERIVALARDAAQLFIECPFLERDAAQAVQKHHLTAWQAGRIARAAGEKRVIPFHFSPRYIDREAELRHEIASAQGEFTPSGGTGI